MKFFPLPSTLRRSAFFLLAGLAFSASTLLHGQSVTYAGASPALNFGSVNVCPAGATTPAPCSKTVTLTYHVAAGGTLGTPKVVTSGVPNLDFTLAPGSTCTGAVATGNTCTVNATFTPKFAGGRPGGVQIIDGSGAVLTSTLIYGLGTGPQLIFSPGTLIPIPCSSCSGPYGLISDGAGNLFVTTYGQDSIYRYVELLAAGGLPIILPSAERGKYSIAIDGAGDLFEAGYDDIVGPLDLEYPVGGRPTITIPYSNQASIYIDVDAGGDLFLIDQRNDMVTELPAGGGSPIVIPFAWSEDGGGFALDFYGNQYFTDYGTNRVVEIKAGTTSQTVLPFKGLNGPESVAVDAAGDVLAPDGFAGIGVQELLASGAQLTLPSIGLSSTQPNNFAAPDQVTLNPAGDVFMALTNILAMPLEELIRSQPPSLTFGNVDGTPGYHQQSIQLQNVGNSPLSLTGLSVSENFAQVAGPGTPADCTAGSSIAPGFQCNLTLEFTQTSSGPVTGTVTLSDNSLNGAPATQVIPLAAVTPAAASASTSTLQFGNIAYPGSATQPLTITNVGGATLTLSPVINGPSYKISSSTCNAGVIAGDSCTLQVQYSPAQVGQHDDRLTINNNGSTTPKVDLLGTSAGVSVVSQNLKFRPTGQSLIFGTISATSSESLPITIIASGVTGTVGLHFSINGPSYTIPAATNGCLAGISSGHSCQLVVLYKPVGTGLHDDTLTITPTAGASASTVGLIGSAD